MGATVVDILDKYISLGLEAPAGSQSSATEEQAQKYPWIPARYLTTIVDITQPVRQYAVDVIEILADHFEKPAYLKYNVAYNVATSGEQDVTIDSSSSSTSDRNILGRSQPTTLETFAARSAGLAKSRDHSFDTAASAFRKGRSDPLFRQAAAFYSERARDQARTYRQAEASFLVEQTSTSNHIDLHGVTVQDGIDIALDRVWRWWNGLGEDRAQRAKDGFTVVTGIGRHSANGISPLRINVFKALVADGWKAEVLTGKYLVTGRR